VRKCIDSRSDIPQKVKYQLPLLCDDIMKRRTYIEDGEKYNTLEIKENDLIKIIHYILGI